MRIVFVKKSKPYILRYGGLTEVWELISVAAAVFKYNSNIYWNGWSSKGHNVRKARLHPFSPHVIIIKRYTAAAQPPAFHGQTNCRCLENREWILAICKCTGVRELKIPLCIGWEGDTSIMSLHKNVRRLLNATNTSPEYNRRPL
jgi:hypothetical protein